LLRPDESQITMPSKNSDRMIGADISFLPQPGDRGARFYDKGAEKDVIVILKDHGILTL